MKFGQSAISVRMGEDVMTYSTLMPELYTPTANQPFRGIWVGDYAGHGCEFLLINQTKTAATLSESGLNANHDNIKSESRLGAQDDSIYSGRLEAIKLTGDPFVPRGEYTWIADDIGPKGLIRIAEEPRFRGARVVRSRGHIGSGGFQDCTTSFFSDWLLTRTNCAVATYVESQLIIISQNKLAQYWVDFGHISFYERIDVDQFLAPKSRR
jgi:hypothetical protein